MDRFAQVMQAGSRRRGLVTSSDLWALRVSKATVALWLETGRLRQVRRGILAVTAMPPSWEQVVLAAVLAAGDGAVASHLTAGVLWGLPNIVREQLEVSTCRADQRRLDGVATHRTGRFLRAEHGLRSGIPVTSVARTLVDCSGRLSVAQLGVATDAGLRRGILRLDDLARCAAGLRPAPGRRLKRIRAVLAVRLEGYEPGESELQMRFVRGLVEHGCPEPVVEHPVSIDGRRYRIDIAYPDAKIGIEVDGWEWHRTRTPFDSDRARANDLVAAGWRVLRATSATAEVKLAEDVSALLARPKAA